jgi:hypothetical protein
MTAFDIETVLKRDLFSETQYGHLADAPHAPVIRRLVTASPWWTRPVARLLFRREIAALRSVSGIPGTPRLMAVERDSLYRTWTEGLPLHIARPGGQGWYRDAFRLLRALRRAGITHNDLAKPQNWLVAPSGEAAVIDFQLASRHRRRGALYRLLAYEDFRHVLKQMKAFAPHLMTPTARRILARRSWPSRVWLATGKKVYNALTRGLFNWSDREGSHGRIEREGPAIRAALLSQAGVREVVLVPFPLPKKGVGIYAFVEGDVADSPAASGADLVQAVGDLPRGEEGEPRLDILRCIAMNQMSGMDSLIGDDEKLGYTVSAIAAGRRNLNDRRFAGGMPPD